jgi:glycosyltransferase involved in cell wall biosynthesis
MISLFLQGHQVFSLSQQEGDLINDFLNSKGVKASSYVLPGKRSGWWYFFRQLIYFIRFCRRHKIDIVYSHLESANFIASVAQLFIKAKVFVCRHHSDQYRLLKRDKDISYRLTYSLARHIIVFSDNTRNYMIKEEGIPADKIIRINLGYDFSLYPAIRTDVVDQIKEKYAADVLLVTVGGLTPLKRPDVSVKILKGLIDMGINAKLIFLGAGELESSLKMSVKKTELTDRVYFPGYVDNVIEYIAASSFLIHPSVSEASCVAVKEAALVAKPVVVCSGIGDFDDYIVNKENGFSFSPDKFAECTVDIVASSFRNRAFLENIGSNLRKSVMEKFSIEKVITHYNKLNTKKD